MDNRMEIKLLETIKIRDNRIWNADLHSQRINTSRQKFYPNQVPIDIRDIITIPPKIDPNMTVKCRMIYGSSIDEVTFHYYYRKQINSLKLVAGDDLVYSYKYADRTAIEKIFSERGACSDVIIVKNRVITDFSYGNLAFYNGLEWHTPKTPLLKGTKRKQLLAEGRIREREILVKDLENYQYCSLINAMLELGEIVVPVEQIYR